MNQFLFVFNDPRVAGWFSTPSLWRGRTGATRYSEEQLSKPVPGFQRPMSQWVTTPGQAAAGTTDWFSITTPGQAAAGTTDWFSITTPGQAAAGATQNVADWFSITTPG